MKSNSFTIVVVAALLNGCSAMNVITNTTDNEESWEGYIGFRGEFQLYDSSTSFLTRDESRCISGALPLAQHRDAASRLIGSHVSVIGERVNWSLRPEDLALIHDGSPVVNRCGGEFVIFARTITAIE